MAQQLDSPRDLYVLGILSRGATYGHELMKTVRASRADRWLSLSEKHVYYILDKLATRGLVTEKLEPGPISRKVYALTASGRDALAELLRSEALRTSFAPHPFDAVFGMLAFTDVLDKPDVLAILRARLDVIQERLDEDQLPSSERKGMERAFGYLALALYEKAQLLLAAERDWLRKVIRKIERSELDALRVPSTYLENHGAVPAKRGGRRVP